MLPAEGSTPRKSALCPGENTRSGHLAGCRCSPCHSALPALFPLQQHSLKDPTCGCMRAVIRHSIAICAAFYAAVAVSGALWLPDPAARCGPSAASPLHVARLVRSAAWLAAE